MYFYYFLLYIFIFILKNIDLENKKKLFFQNFDKKTYTRLIMLKKANKFFEIKYDNQKPVKQS